MYKTRATGHALHTLTGLSLAAGLVLAVFFFFGTANEDVATGDRASPSLQETTPSAHQSVATQPPIEHTESQPSPPMSTPDPDDCLEEDQHAPALNQSPYDDKGALKPVLTAIRDLSPEALENLAESGSLPAMQLLSMTLFAEAIPSLNTFDTHYHTPAPNALDDTPAIGQRSQENTEAIVDKVRKIDKARQWAYQSALHGSGYHLALLARSYQWQVMQTLEKGIAFQHEAEPVSPPSVSEDIQIQEAVLYAGLTEEEKNALITQISHYHAFAALIEHAMPLEPYTSSLPLQVVGGQAASEQKQKVIAAFHAQRVALGYDPLPAHTFLPRGDECAGELSR